MRNQIRKIFHQEILLYQVFLPLFLLLIYNASFAYISLKFIPLGVNHYFTNRIWKLTIIPLCIVGIIILYRKCFREEANDRHTKIKQNYPRRYLTFLLLPLTPVVQYIIINHRMLKYQDILFTIVFFIFFSGIFIVLVPWLFRNISPPQLLMSMGVSFSFTLISMASLSQNFNWFRFGSLKILGPYMAGVFVIVLFLSAPIFKKYLYLILMAILLLNNVPTLFSIETPTLEPELNNQNNLVAAVNGKVPKKTPNIYFLIYDSYVPLETMGFYGIDNSVQEDFLRSNGFKIYPNTYSVGSTTLDSVNRALEVSTSWSNGLRGPVSGRGTVQHLLKSYSYYTYGVFASDFMFRGTESHYDQTIPEKEEVLNNLLITAILTGEFRFDLDIEEQSYFDFIINKQKTLLNIKQSPAFIFMHTNTPGHSQNSGKCLPGETDIYSDNVEIANQEMKKDIRTIVSEDPNAIVIIAGDHGPALTKNCLATADYYDIQQIDRKDIQDRFAIFLAIKWPDQSFNSYDQITVFQDVFPAVFAYLFEDEAILESKIPPKTITNHFISEASVVDGIIIGGINDAEPLFLSSD